MPRSRAITSAILFSKPSDLLFENGRLSGSPHTRSTFDSSAIARGHAGANAIAAALRSTLTKVKLFTGYLRPPSVRPAAPQIDPDYAPGASLQGAPGAWERNLYSSANTSTAPPSVVALSS